MENVTDSFGVDPLAGPCWLAIRQAPVLRGERRRPILLYNAASNGHAHSSQSVATGIELLNWSAA